MATTRERERGRREGVYANESGRGMADDAREREGDEKLTTRMREGDVR